MTRRHGWGGIAAAFVTTVALSFGTVAAADKAAADKAKVDQATRGVEQGAKQIGQGQLGSGFKQMFTGIGHTIVEGAKYSGENIKAFFQKVSR